MDLGVAGIMSSSDYNKIVNQGYETSDANNCINNGVYYLASGLGAISNTPANYVLILVLSIDGKVVQIAFRIDDPSKRWIRVKESSTASFKEWSSF